MKSVLLMLILSALLLVGATAPQSSTFDDSVAWQELLSEVDSYYRSGFQFMSGFLILEECEEEKRKAVESGDAIEKPMSVKRVQSITPQSGAVSMTVLSLIR